MWIPRLHFRQGAVFANSINGRDGVVEPHAFSETGQQGFDLPRLRPVPTFSPVSQAIPFPLHNLALTHVLSSFSSLVFLQREKMNMP